MSKKVIKIGTSLGVTISKATLQKAGIDAGDRVDVTFNTKKGVIEISSTKKAKPISKYLIKTNEIIDAYKEELKKLNDEW